MQKNIYDKYLVHVVSWDGLIEGAVEIVEEVDDLHRSALRRQGCEANDVREVDGHVTVDLSFDVPASL